MSLKILRKLYRPNSLKLLSGALALILVTIISVFIFSQKDIILVVDGKTSYLKTSASSVKDALKEAGISLKPADKVTPSLKSALRDGAKIEVKKAVPITLKFERETVKTYTTGKTVEEALEDAGFSPSLFEETKPHKHATVYENICIFLKYKHHKEDVETIKAQLPFSIVETPDPNVYQGKKDIIQLGENGFILKIYKTFLAEGKIRKTLVSFKILKSPKAQIVKVGVKKNTLSKKPTKIAMAPLLPPAPSSVSRGSGRTLVMSATAYTPGHGCGYTTATGIRARYGVVAVDPRVIPLGTRLYIEGYGNAIAADTGGAIKGMRIDLCYNTLSEARAFGRRQVVVHILP